MKQNLLTSGGVASLGDGRTRLDLDIPVRDRSTEILGFTRREGESASDLLGALPSLEAFGVAGVALFPGVSDKPDLLINSKHNISHHLQIKKK